MIKLFPVLSAEEFETIHSFVLDYQAVADQEEELQLLAGEMLQWGTTLEQLGSYLFDRMIIERGGMPSDRGRMFEKEAKQLKKDMEKNRRETEQKLREQEEYRNLDSLLMKLTVDSSLTLAVYMPLLSEIEKDNPLVLEDV